ncbi:MAG: hypothetical protein ACRD40_02705 [Candidatus Acidiferrales bacterium]
MRFFGFLLAGVLLAGSSAVAQVSSSPSLLNSTTTTNLAVNTSSATAQPVSFRLSAKPAPEPQVPVIGVYERYSFQAYVGYTFLRFYEVPHHIYSLNGFDTSISYYPGAGRIGADGEFLGAFGHQDGFKSKLPLALGGVRARWAAPRGLELWAHGLAGRAHYVPQTAFGPQGAFAYEVGIGVDASGSRQRIAYRLEVDMVGTKFFHTYQLSPKASIGVVFKF